MAIKKLFFRLGLHRQHKVGQFHSVELAQETFLLGNAHNLETAQDRHIGGIGECEVLDVAENRLALLGHIVAPLVEHAHDVPPGANVRGTSGTRWNGEHDGQKGGSPQGKGIRPLQSMVTS